MLHRRPTNREGNARRLLQKIYDQDRGIYFSVWHAERTLAALDELIQDCMEKKGAANGK